MFLITDNNALHAQAATSSTAIAVPGSVATTSTPSEKKITKRKLPEPRDSWKYVAGKTHRSHIDAITYHKTFSTIM
jgi:hypothetical protein